MGHAPTPTLAVKDPENVPYALADIMRKRDRLTADLHLCVGLLRCSGWTWQAIADALADEDGNTATKQYVGRLYADAQRSVNELEHAAAGPLTDSNRWAKNELARLRRLLGAITDRYYWLVYDGRQVGPVSRHYTATATAKALRKPGSFAYRYQPGTEQGTPWTPEDEPEVADLDPEADPF